MSAGDAAETSPGGQGRIDGHPLEAGTIESFRAALVAAGLPADDLGEPGVTPFRFCRGVKTVGYGAVESYGPVVLLRSIVVIPDARAQGVGRAIVDHLLAHADGLGAERAFLFTTDALAYFQGLGFEAVERRLAPASILTTRQASRLCPASATLLARRVSR